MFVLDKNLFFCKNYPHIDENHHLAKYKNPLHFPLFE